MWKTPEWIVKFDVDTQPQMSPREEGSPKGGVVAYGSMLCERPPRLRRLGGFGVPGQAWLIL